MERQQLDRLDWTKTSFGSIKKLLVTAGFESVLLFCSTSFGAFPLSRAVRKTKKNRFGIHMLWSSGFAKEDGLRSYNLARNMDPSPQDTSVVAPRLRMHEHISYIHILPISKRDIIRRVRAISSIEAARGRNELWMHFEGNVAAAHENSINALSSLGRRYCSSIFQASSDRREILLIRKPHSWDRFNLPFV